MHHLARCFVQQSRHFIQDGGIVADDAKIFRNFASEMGSKVLILNMPLGYNTRLLAADIKTYFELNEAALEVLIFKGKSELSIYRRFVSNSRFYSEFKKTYEQ